MLHLENQGRTALLTYEKHLVCFRTCHLLIIQSTLFISSSKGLYTILRDIRTSTYKICKIEEKIFEQPNLTNINVIGLLKLDIC